MRQHVYTMFISNNHALRHLWRKGKLVKFKEVSRYYENDCNFLARSISSRASNLFLKARSNDIKSKDELSWGALVPWCSKYSYYRSSHPEVLLRKGVLKICSKFTGQHPCWSVISIEIALRHGCSPVNLLHLFRTPFPNNLSYFTLFSSDFGFSVVDFEQVHVSWLPAALTNLILYCWCFPVNFAKIFSQIINRRGNIVHEWH